MSTIKLTRTVLASAEVAGTLPDDFLNAYEIENAGELESPVNIYSVGS
jgi:hypothetical protein